MIVCCVCAQAYVWEKNRDVTEWLQSQLSDDKWPQSVLCENIRCLKRDYVIQQIRRYVTKAARRHFVSVLCKQTVSTVCACKHYVVQ